MPKCPVCKVQSVKKQFTWKGLLYGVFCFPCGMYCCLKANRQLYCPLCGCQVVYSTGESPLIGNRYRFYSSFRANRQNTATQSIDTTISTVGTSSRSTAVAV
ncbi:hypothetical protein Tcan_09053 [Toxocara canis]|uniref:Uncharacterized protein n=2 Tax=Toxocara canis TaxID=6265 RepID=A0A0B2VBY3_TOXCA|nr:hypothetical protein Tcan_09053 [Toxocara canis]VDM42849.1 unnamed protein product [Toxocara canis]